MGGQYIEKFILFSMAQLSAFSWENTILQDIFTDEIYDQELSGNKLPANGLVRLSVHQPTMRGG